MDGYQIAFEDIQRARIYAMQPGRTAFIDESGNFGFDFEKEDVSTHYIVCAVIVNNSVIVEIEQKVAEIRNKNFGKSEMKSSLISSNHSRRAKILTELLMLDFSLIILIADKQEFYKDTPLKHFRETFIKFLHRKLYDSMYCVYPKLKIIEDECGSSEFQKGYRKYIEAHRPNLNFFNEYDFDYTDSRDSNIVQIADIIAGSVLQHINDPQAPDVLKIFQSRIRDLINFPNIFVPFNVDDLSADASFDDIIYALADKCATDYVEKNKESDEEDVRLRVLFLRLILFRAHNYKKTEFMYSGEIVRLLSQLSEKRVTKNYLYRKIIAPLRDVGVLISSSSHGYKLPTSINDIYTYINQTVSVVGPMLSRIEICRNLIDKQSNGRLDILDAQSLERYKRYFGDY